MSNRPAFTSEGTYTPDLLIAGDHPVRTTGITIVSGETIARGSLLGKVTATGKYKLSFSAASDGSQVPVGIAVEDMDASGGDKKSAMYISGDFNASRVQFGEAHTVATVKDALAQKSIYLHVPLAATTPVAQVPAGN